MKGKELITRRVKEKIRLARERHKLRKDEAEREHANYMAGLEKEHENFVEQINLQHRNTLAETENLLRQKEVAIIALEIVQKTPENPLDEDQMKVFAREMTKLLIERDDVKEQLRKTDME